MAPQIYQYNQMVDAALRGVVRQVLTDIAKNGVRGAHHFYVSFHTDWPDVRMPDYLRTRYPQEITIVLQHQFWDLVVGEDGFDVTVSFNKQPEKLYVPFAALTAFVDPSVRFGLQFEEVGDKEKPADGEQSGAERAPSRGQQGTPERAKERGAGRFAVPSASMDAKAGEPPQVPAAAGEKPDPAGEKPATDGAKVVTLDAFRKK